VAPILLETLPKDTSLQCRQLNRQWTRELDHQSQFHPSLLRLELEVSDGPAEETHIPSCVNRFSNADQIRKFMEEMEAHPDNPFPGRTLHLLWESVERPEASVLLSCRQFWASVTQLLERFGTHV